MATDSEAVHREATRILRDWTSEAADPVPTGKKRVVRLVMRADLTVKTDVREVDTWEEAYALCQKTTEWAAAHGAKVWCDILEG